MTAPILSFPVAPDAAEASFDLVFCAWRGACVELFARAEQDVIECIEALLAAGYDVGATARHEAPRQRLRALRKFLERESFNGQEKPARDRIDSFDAWFEFRGRIVHGMLKHGLPAQLLARSYEKKELKESRQAFTIADALARLDDLQKAQHGLRRALSHIKAQAKRRGAE